MTTRRSHDSHGAMPDPPPPGTGGATDPPASGEQRLHHLFENNRRWAAGRLAAAPDFFAKLAAQNAPDYLWIGCSDSRVPANDIVGLLPGELFVHRNVANVVVHTDLNCLSVLQYAVDVLRVRDIIVCGHYDCNGVRAALEGRKLGLIDNWLRHVQDVSLKHRARLDGLTDTGVRVNRLCELNVIEQAIHVCETTIVQDAWARAQPLTVHALIYSVRNGLLQDLGFCAGGPDELPAAAGRALDLLESR